MNMKKPTWLSKIVIVSIASVFCAALNILRDTLVIHFLFTTSQFLFGKFTTSLAESMISHLDISTLATLETFVLTNIAAFITMFNFINERRGRNKKKSE